MRAVDGKQRIYLEWPYKGQASAKIFEQSNAPLVGPFLRSNWINSPMYVWEGGSGA